MTSADFNRSIQQTRPILADLGVLRLPIWRTYEPDDEFAAAAVNPSKSYSDVYLIGLELSQYTYLLNDFSYFQYTYFSDVTPFGVRYAYYPNPYRAASFEQFLLDVGIRHDDPFATELYDQYLTEQQPSDGIAPLRYEIDFDNYRPFHHPCSHMHIGHHVPGRTALARVLTPKAFTLFCVKLHFPEEWEREGQRTLTADGIGKFDAEFISATASCASLPDEHFTQHERRQLHLA